MIELKAGLDDNDRRLDRVLRRALPDYSLSLIHRLLRQGKVLVNGIVAGPDKRIQSGAEIQIHFFVNNSLRKVNKRYYTAGQAPHPTPAAAAFRSKREPSALPPILWRSSGIIVFNKPAGLATHGKHSLETIVSTHLAGTLQPSLSFRPGPLHRLDKPTSGAIAFSETIDGARLFSRLLRERKLSKTYLAIVEGSISGEEIWQDTLIRDTDKKKTKVVNADVLSDGAANAFTKVRSLAFNNRYSLVEVNIITGRTHQIRAQAAAHGHPLAGDKKYGGHGFTGFFLHAWKIEVDGKWEDVPDDFNRKIIAPLPKLFISSINETFSGKPICR